MLVKVVYVESERGSMAFHENCSSEVGDEVFHTTDFPVGPGYCPIFCYGCQESLGYYCPEKVMAKFLLNVAVNIALESAMENGYMEVKTQKPEVVAHDLIACDPEVERLVGMDSGMPGEDARDEYVALVAKYVTSWRQSKN